MPMADLVLTAPNRKQPKCSPTGEWMSNVREVQRVEDLSEKELRNIVFLKKKTKTPQILIHVRTWNIFSNALC